MSLKPRKPEPSFEWKDDECAGNKCGCGEELIISISHPTRCPKCERIFQLYQVTAIQERSPDSVNRCPYCGGVRYDDGRYCPECKKYEDGTTWEDISRRLNEYLAQRKEEEGAG